MHGHGAPAEREHEQAGRRRHGVLNDVERAAQPVELAAGLAELRLLGAALPQLIALGSLDLEERHRAQRQLRLGAEDVERALPPPRPHAHLSAEAAPEEDEQGDDREQDGEHQRVQHDENHAQADRHGGRGQHHAHEHRRHRIHALGVVHHDRVQPPEARAVEVCARQRVDPLEQGGPQVGDGALHRLDDQIPRKERQPRARQVGHEDRGGGEEQAAHVARWNELVEGVPDEESDWRQNRGLRDRQARADQERPPGLDEEACECAPGVELHAASASDSSIRRMAAGPPATSPPSSSLNLGTSRTRSAMAPRAAPFSGSW